MITEAGAEYILKVNFGFTSQITHFYIGLISDYDPNSGSWTEFVDYAGDRPRWLPDAVSGVHGTTLSAITIEANANISGIFLTTQFTKGDMGGTIFSIGTTLFAQEVKIAETYVLDFTIAWP